MLQRGRRPSKISMEWGQTDNKPRKKESETTSPIWVFLNSCAVLIRRMKQNEMLAYIYGNDNIQDTVDSLP